MPSAPGRDHTRPHCSRRCRQWRRPAWWAPARVHSAASAAKPSGRPAAPCCPWTRSRTRRRCRHSRANRAAPPRSARAVLIDSPMIASRPSRRRASATGMSSQPTCTPSAPAASATSTRSLIRSGTKEPHERRLDRARLLDHAQRRAGLVAQLHKRRAALHERRRERAQFVPAAAVGIDQGIETKIDTHQQTFARARIAARSRLNNASRI